MKILLPVISLFVMAITLCGCAPALRQSMSPGEGHWTFTRQTKLNKDQGFSLVKTNIAVIYNNYNVVVKSEDREAGTFVIKALVEAPSPANSFVGMLNYNYTLIITVSDESILYDYTVGKVQNGDYGLCYPFPKTLEYIYSQFVIQSTELSAKP